MSSFVREWVSMSCIASLANWRSVLLGYLRKYPSELVGGWSSGTGLAGVGGAALYLAFGMHSLVHSQLYNQGMLLSLVTHSVQRLEECRTRKSKSE